MNSRNKCQEIGELLPIFFKSGLKQDEAEAVRSHLESCPDCRDAYARERVLFTVASSDAAANLDSHLDADLLDAYSRDLHTISGSQRSELETHLSDCAICREVVEKLKTLPSELDDLMPTGGIPLITELDRTVGTTSEDVAITDLTRRLWRPLTAVAAAAVIIIVGVTMMTYDGSEPSARLEGTFPAVTRTVSTPTVFETESESFTFVGRVYVDPEENHDYRLQIRDVALDSLIFQVAPLVTFDSLGFATLELIMSPGTYELVLYDILDNDSLEITQPFEIHMKP